jgi:hypothetical protein
MGFLFPQVAHGSTSAELDSLPQAIFHSPEVIHTALDDNHGRRNLLALILLDFQHMPRDQSH